jgi:hypothetical protein
LRPASWVEKKLHDVDVIYTVTKIAPASKFSYDRKIEKNACRAQISYNCRDASRIR